MTSPALMGKLGNCFLVWRRWLSRGYARHDVSLKQYYLLRQLEGADYLYPADIADLLFCDRPTATVVIRNLEKAGWVRRERDSEDGKRVRIALTDRGAAKLAELRDDPRRPERRFDPFACFSAEEKAQFDALLSRLARHLEALPPE